jgi:hypothetical protein
MPLLQRHIEELRRIYLAETGEDLSNDEAWAMATRLLTLARNISQYDNDIQSGDLRAQVDRVGRPPSTLH